MMQWKIPGYWESSGYTILTILVYKKFQLNSPKSNFINNMFHNMSSNFFSPHTQTFQKCPLWKPKMQVSNQSRRSKEKNSIHKNYLSSLSVYSVQICRNSKKEDFDGKIGKILISLIKPFKASFEGFLVKITRHFHKAIKTSICMSHRKLLKTKKCH